VVSGSQAQARLVALELEILLQDSLAQEPSTYLFAHLIPPSLLCRPFKWHSSKAFHHPTFTAIIHGVTFINHESRRPAIPCDHRFWYGIYLKQKTGT